MYGFTQFYLVCFFLLTLRKAVLLTFKSKGVFFDVDTQKCLLQGNLCFILALIGGSVFPVSAARSLNQLCLSSILSPHLQYCSTLKMYSDCILFVRQIFFFQCILDRMQSRNSCCDLNDKDILSESVEYCMVYTRVSLGIYNFNNISMD